MLRRFLVILSRVALYYIIYFPLRFVKYFLLFFYVSKQKKSRVLILLFTVYLMFAAKLDLLLRG